MRFKAWAGDRILPLLLLVGLALSGVLVHAFWTWLALGIIAADLARQAYNVRLGAYTPARAFLAVYLLSIVGGSLAEPSWTEPSPWCATVIGAAFVAVGYLSAHRKRLLEPQRSAGEP